MPQRVPISPQWRMNFCWMGVSGGLDLMCSDISVETEITGSVARLSSGAGSRGDVESSIADVISSRALFFSMCRWFVFDVGGERETTLCAPLTACCDLLTGIGRDTPERAGKERATPACAPPRHGVSRTDVM